MEIHVSILTNPIWTKFNNISKRDRDKAIIGLGSDKNQIEMTAAFLESCLCGFFVTYRPQIEAEISNSSCFWLQSDLSRPVPLSFLCNMDEDNDQDEMKLWGNKDRDKNVRIQSSILAVFGFIVTWAHLHPWVSFAINIKIMIK